MRSVAAKAGRAGLLLVMVTAPAAAQVNRAGGLDSVTVLQLKPDRFVRIRVPDLGRVQGHVGFRTDAELVLKTESENKTISLGAVDTLWVRGRRTGKGALIGAILGAGSGALLGALVGGLCEYDCDGDFVIGGGVFGAAAGGLTGAIVGAAIPRWRRIFPR